MPITAPEPLVTLVLAVALGLAANSMLARRPRRLVVRAEDEQRRRYEMRNQAGGQHVFEKLYPERFPLCVEGVLPPVLFSSRRSRSDTVEVTRRPTDDR